MAQRIRRRVRRLPGATTRDGYGSAHQKRRKAAIAALRDGDPCARCGKPMYRGDPVHLDHDDTDRSQYRGLSHAYCNVAASNRSPRRQRTRKAPIQTASWPSARRW